MMYKEIILDSGATPNRRLFTVLISEESGDIYLAEGMEVIYGPGLDRGQSKDRSAIARILHYVENPGPDIYDLIFEEDPALRMHYQFEKRQFYRQVLSLF